MDGAPAGRAGYAMPPVVVSWVWASGSAAWLAPALLLALGFLGMVRLLWPAFVADHGMELAAFIVVWGVVGMAGAAFLARVLLGNVAVGDRVALIVAIGGIAIAATLQFSLHAWAVDKFGLFEPEYIGWTVLLPFGLTAVAVAMFGISLAPRVFDLAPRTSVVIGGLLSLATASLNLPGAVDGIASRALPLALALVASCIWVVCACWIAVRR
ncbi:MAG: hypothetical protein WEF51_05270 [Chloroflexota bacterium]